MAIDSFDQEWLTNLRYRENNRKAWAEIYKGFAPQLLRFFLIHHVRKDVAEDLVQHVFVKLIEKAELYNFDSIERLRALLWRTAHNLLIDLFRKEKTIHKVQRPIEKKDEDALLSDLAEEIIDPFENRIERFVETLKKTDKIIFKLRFIDEKPLNDICEETNMSYTALASRLSRIRQKLWHFLAK